MNDKTPLRELKGVGDKTEKLFQKIGITTVEERLRYYPRTYDVYVAFYLQQFLEF